MDLVSNLANTVITKAVGGNSQEATSNIDLNDNTFSDLLEKQLNNLPEQNGQNFIDNMGLSSVSAVSLGELEGFSSADKLSAINKINTYDIAQQAKYTNGKDFSMEEVLSLFNPIFETKPTMADTTSSNLFNFERKTAASQYSRYAKNIVTDLSEFVSDALKIS